jgi:hypothetical protein
MRRNLKVLGLALAAVFALTAVAASAASAHSITAGAYEANVSGVQTNTNTLSNGVREVSCSTAKLTGALTAAAETITIIPEYEGCTGNAGTTATIDMNGCDYTLTVTGTSTGTVTVMCPTGKKIEVTIWASGKAHTEPRLCTLAVEAQGPLSGGTYTNLSGTEGMQLKLALSTLDVKRTEGTAANCGAENKTTGTYNGEIHATAKHAGTATTLMAE